MLKEVGASGQISLGKKYAGQLFDLQTEADGRIVMRPVKVVPVTPTVQKNLRAMPAIRQLKSLVRRIGRSSIPRRLPSTTPGLPGASLTRSACGAGA